MIVTGSKRSNNDNGANTGIKAVILPNSQAMALPNKVIITKVLLYVNFSYNLYFHGTYQIL